VSVSATSATPVSSSLTGTGQAHFTRVKNTVGCDGVTSVAGIDALNCSATT